MRIAVACLLLAALAVSVANAQPYGPPLEHFPPKSGKPAPVVVLLSGASGTTNYRYYGTDVSELGYYAVLVDGNAILSRVVDGEWNLRQVIANAQATPNALPGKVFVVGFSQGGGGALAHAVVMPELVSGVVAYYPAISFASGNLPGLAERIQVPVLVLAGETDRFNNCCLIEHMRELNAAAKAKKVPLELVTYRGAGHGFNMWGNAYQERAANDAWRRTREMLARYLPLP